MNLVEISVYAEAYYSGNSYGETIYLLKDDYLKTGININGREMCFGELDGKHSEVYGTISVTTIETSEQESHNFTTDDDGDMLFWYLSDEAGFGDDLGEIMSSASEYIETIDCLVDVSYRVRRSDLEKLNNYIQDNIRTGL